MLICDNKESKGYSTVCMNEYNMINGAPMLDCKDCLREQKLQDELELESSLEIYDVEEETD